VITTVPFAGCVTDATASGPARVRCGAAAGCSNGTPNGASNGYVLVFFSSFVLADSTRPAITVGGALTTSGWKSGTRTVDVAASDNVGIREARALVDGVPRAVHPRACSYTRPVPCPSGTDRLAVALGAVADGAHTLTVQAIDSAGNSSVASRSLWVDNTAPASPQNPLLVGGAGWRSGNDWSIRWENPRQSYAPITGARFSLCPEEADSADPLVSAAARRRCASGIRSGSAISSLSGIKVPGPGRWTLRLWLRDAAGNENPGTAVRLAGLGYDPSPPTGVAFAEQNPADPARLTVVAIDAVSGIASGDIELRRRGEDFWRPLITQVTPSGLTAIADDEHLPRGAYDMRAVAMNAAGLQQGSAIRTDGRPATLLLPLRLGSRLTAGTRAKRCVRGHRCHLVLRSKMTRPLSRPTRLVGRLTVRGRPVAYGNLAVFGRLAKKGAPWSEIGAARTSSNGRFSYVLPAGPSRLIRFRYAGTPTVRGVNATVRLAVPARTTIAVNRRHAINGEYVMFSGRVRGGFMPPIGTLVELQVYTRGRWRIFAQPRASTENGRWKFQYRFETIRGTVRFRFRARIRRQPGYPFTTGRSRTIAVTVHGL
jgi:hypothetical protein